MLQYWEETAGGDTKAIRWPRGATISALNNTLVKKKNHDLEFKTCKSAYLIQIRLITPEVILLCVYEWLPLHVQ